MSTELGQSIVKKYNQGAADKTTTMTLWQQIANYHLPNRSDYLVEKWPGQKRMTYIFDATPVWALETYAAGLHSLLTSNSLQWGYLRTYDEKLNNDDDCRDWLNEASTVMYNIFSSPKQNFASQSYEVFLDTGSIGSACMGVLDSLRGDLLFTTRHMKECVWFENEEDRIDTNMRMWKWTAKQAVQAWGEKCGARVMDAFKKGDENTKFEFIHSVGPRVKRDPQRVDRKHKAWESVYVSVADAEEIAVGGFDEFPYMCVRESKASGEVYGRGRGTLALPDTQMLNELKKLVLKGAQMQIHPILQAPDNGFLLAIKTVPGSINYYREGSRDRIEAVKTDAQTQIGVDMLNGLQAQIARTFFVDMLRMPVDPQDPSSEGKGITATYWLQRRDKEMMMMSPLLARQQSEFLDPLFNRVFNKLWRKSVARKFDPRLGAPFSPPPAKLSGVPLRVEYVSPLALAQKSTQMDGVTRILQLQQQLRTIDNQSQIVINGEQILRLASRDFNAPVSVLKTSEQLQAEAQQKAEADAAMQNHAAIANLAGAAKDGTGALKNLADAQNANGNTMQEAA